MEPFLAQKVLGDDRLHYLGCDLPLVRIHEGEPNCDLANLVEASVDSEGHFSQEVTVTIGENFVLGAVAVDGSQGGAVWIPVLDSNAAAELAVTGAHSWSIAIAALAAILAGFGLLVAGRRHELA